MGKTLHFPALTGWTLDELQATLRTMLDIAAGSAEPLDQHFYDTIDQLAAEVLSRR